MQSQSPTGSAAIWKRNSAACELRSRDYEQAETLAPLDVKYILALGNDALDAGTLPLARAVFTHGLAVAPGSANVLAGLGLAQLRSGNRSAALALLARARASDPRAPMIPVLERALQ